MQQRWVPRTQRDGLVMDSMLAVRAFSDAMDRMHGSLRGDMDMNATDLAALRMLVIREQRDQNVSPHDIADHLGISTASTTKLLDRLSASGHVERRPHPRDRRARVVTLTPSARADFHRHFGQRMARLRGALERYGDDELRLAARLFTDITDALLPDDATVVAGREAEG